MSDKAAETAGKARDAVAEAAAKADKSIQNAIGNGSQAAQAPSAEQK